MTIESDEASNTSIACDEPPLVLRTHELTLRYGSNLAVDRLSLTVRRGEIYGFLGRNGAGKTSTIRSIMGISHADSGTIEFNGARLKRIGNREKRLIGYVSQEQFFYPWMTCNRIGRFVGGLFPTWDATEYQRLLSVLDLPPDRKVSHLSGGMKVKLALALALAHRPEILILDEPTAGLDPVARREFLDIIRRQASQFQRTTFFSSHLIDEVERVSDRVGIIHRGRLLFEGPLNELQDQVREVSIDQRLPSVVDGESQGSQATLQQRCAEAGLRFLRGGLSDRPTFLFQGSPDHWRTANEQGITSAPLSLEDSFIALASDDLGKL
jgi:ABC-2 type transport system ATP-binding protein